MGNLKTSTRLSMQETNFVRATSPSLFRTTRRLGYGSATALIVLCVLELLIQGVMFVTLGAGAIETNPAYYLTQMPALLTTPLFVVLMACLIPIVELERRIFALIGFAFAIIYAALGGINYYVQLTAIRLSVMGDGIGSLTPFVMPNLSVMFAFDILGYFFLTLSGLAVVPLFKGAGIERGIRWILILNFVVGVAAVAGNLIGNPLLLLPILPTTWIVTGLVATLMAIWFRRSYNIP